MEAVATAFLAVLLAELGDKTQLATIALAARSRRPLRVGLLAFLALALSTLIAVLVGWLLSVRLPQQWLAAAGGLLFIVMGIAPREERKGEGLSEGALGVFGAIFLAELGDKTQLAVLTLAATCGSPLGTLIGACLAFFVTSITGAVLGEAISRRVEARRIELVSRALFVVIGVVLLLSALSG